MRAPLIATWCEVLEIHGHRQYRLREVALKDHRSELNAKHQEDYEERFDGAHQKVELGHRRQLLLLLERQIELRFE